MYMNDRKRKMKVLRLIEQTMEIDELPENDERLLKKAEIKRDETGQRGTRTSIENINRESIDGTCVGWQARWTVSLPAIVNNREKTMRLQITRKKQCRFSSARAAGLK
jgi:hypothetical protein